MAKAEIIAKREKGSSVIVRIRSIDRIRSPRAALEATGRHLQLTKDVVETMPRGEGNEAEIILFPLHVAMSNKKLVEYYGHLVPADPYTLAAMNEADPAFADERPHATHWKEVKGHWCFAEFRCSRGRRSVSVDRIYGFGWDAFWWFACLHR